METTTEKETDTIQDSTVQNQVQLPNTDAGIPHQPLGDIYEQLDKLWF